MSNDELPEGWAQASLVEICELNPPKPPADFLPPEAEVTFAPMPAVEADSGTLAAPQLRPFAKVRNGHPSFRDGDVIMAKITPCMENGKAAVVRGLKNGIGFGSTEFHVFRPTPVVLAEYVYHFIRQESFREAAAAEMTGSVGQKRVPAGFLNQVVLPLPPLGEQKRIVAKVEALLARVNAARHRLAKAPTILKRFRQSVLAAACSGRLTQDWRHRNPTVPTARQLFEEIQVSRQKRYREQVALALKQGKRKPKSQANSQRSDLPLRELEDFPPSWICARLDDLTHLITDGTHRTPQYQEQGVPFLSVKNVRPFAIKDDEVKWISEQEHQEINSRCNPEPGDILYTKVGTFGYAAVNRLTYSYSLFVSVALIKPVQECFIPDYAAIALNSEILFDQARERVSGSGVPDLHLIEIRDFAIPLPPLAEQHEIARRVQALLRLADAIENWVAAATARAGKLTQAILAKAFRGELVPTEAELARREGREYEPASALLDRIRAERAQDNGNCKKPPRKPIVRRRAKGIGPPTPRD